MGAFVLWATGSHRVLAYNSTGYVQVIWKREAVALFEMG
jgi:hypothetical protein